MQKVARSSITRTSTEIWAKMCSPSLTSHAQFIEAPLNDGRLMRHEGSLDCETKWKQRTYTLRVAVIES